mmetsp:Transcript_24320/g.36062  ORF Transcript_24320/g.36062 Transcript_24320/m.36062 type:complete len:369 (-) Transcript_24320:295-1401(-)
MIPPKIKINNKTFWFISSSKSSFELHDIVSIEGDSTGSWRSAMTGIIQYLDDDIAGVQLIGNSVGKGNTNGALNGVQNFFCHPRDGMYASRSKLTKCHLTARCQERLRYELESQGIYYTSSPTPQGGQQNKLENKNKAETILSLESRLDSSTEVTSTLGVSTRELQNKLENQKETTKEMAIELENATSKYKLLNEKEELNLIDMEVDFKHKQENLEESVAQLEQQKTNYKKLKDFLAVAHNELLKLHSEADELVVEMQKDASDNEESKEQEQRSQEKKIEQFFVDLERRKTFVNDMTTTLKEAKKEQEPRSQENNIEQLFAELEKRKSVVCDMKINLKEAKKEALLEARDLTLEGAVVYWELQSLLKT